MRIAFFTDSFLPTHDGVAQVTASLAHALAQLGHTVTIFTAHRPGLPRYERLPDGTEVVRSLSIPVPHYGQYRWAILPLWTALGRRFGRTFDLVHIHTPGVVGASGFLAARHWKVPLLGTFHTNVKEMRASFPDDPLTGIFFRLAWWFNAGLYWRCDRTTVPTLAALAALEEGSRKPYRAPIELVPNGIEVERFHPGIQEPDWRRRTDAGDAPLVTFLGRLTQDKGVHRFLDALSSLPGSLRFRGVVAGTGIEDENVRRRIDTDPLLRGRVVFVGPVSEEEKPALLSQSRVFVLPSVADTSSVATLEAMASGAACVVTTRGGPRALAQNGATALMADPENVPEISARIRELLEDPSRAELLSRRAVRYVRESCSIQATARMFLNLYLNLLEERSSLRRVQSAYRLPASAPPR